MDLIPLFAELNDKIKSPRIHWPKNVNIFKVPSVGGK